MISRIFPPILTNEINYSHRMTIKVYDLQTCANTLNSRECVDIEEKKLLYRSIDNIAVS